ncbi:MAG: hypothetical protein HY961_03735 [Ignavibacteriae bacterium]|nr:hypothetical protein [Ignavibacteriota bacterium]
MLGRVAIRISTANNALVVPKEAIVNEDTKPTLFVADNGVARERTVRLGVRSKDKVQILEGLKTGELVVSFGQRKLKDGALISFEQ